MTVTGLAAQANFHRDYVYADETAHLRRLFAVLELADSGSITVNATGKLTIRERPDQYRQLRIWQKWQCHHQCRKHAPGGRRGQHGVDRSQSALAGQSGDVTINAAGKIDMQNGFRISANTLGSDDGGQVNVKAGRSITMRGDSTVISSVTGQPVDSELDTFAGLFGPFFQKTRGIGIVDYPSLRAALGVAPSPNDLMKVLAGLNTITDGPVFPGWPSPTSRQVTGGKVSITAPVLAVNAGAQIETSTAWDGNAGAIEGNVGSLFLHDGAVIGSRSGAVRLDRGFTVGTGNAGTINIAATDTV